MKKNIMLTDKEAGTEIELKVMVYIDCIASYRRYWPRTYLSEQSKKELKIAYNMGNDQYVAMSFFDEDGKKVWKELDKEQFFLLAKAREKYGGMDICALSIDSNGSTRTEYIEVKTDRNCKFLYRDKPQGVSAACVGFELWDNVYFFDENNVRHLKDRSKWHKGWLHGYLHPNDHNAEKIQEFQNKVDSGETYLVSPPLYTTPSVFIYGLEYEVETEEPKNYGKRWDVKPYAYVCFEDTDALFEHLNKKVNGALDPWTIDPEEVWNRRQFPSLIYSNMLYVPLDELLQLPGVTLTVRKDLPTEETVKNWASHDYRWNETTASNFDSRCRFLYEHKTTDEKRNNRLDALDIVFVDGITKEIDPFSDEFDEILKQYSDDSKPLNIFFAPFKEKKNS